MKVFIVVLGLVCLALGARVDIITIDDFTVGINNIFVEIPSSPAFPLIDNDFFTDDGSGASHLLGDERDLILIVNSGGVGSIVTSQAFSDATPPNWTTSCPEDGAGQGVLQWDGKDGGSPTIAFTGLGGIDITAGGGDAFHAFLTTDIDTSYTFDVYTSSSAKCTTVVAIPGNPGVNVDKIVTFSSFTGSCDFTKVGAIVLTVAANDNVDSTLFFLKTSGTPAAPPPSGAPTPAPSVVGSLQWYTFDDDDEGLSPCGEVERKTYFLADDNLIYYYFYGKDINDDDFLPFYYSSVDNNGAGTLAVSVLVSLLAVLAL